MRNRLFMTILTVVLAADVGQAQFGAEETKGPTLGDKEVQQWQVGVIVSANSGPCAGIVATLPVPVDWPEQQVKIVDEEISPFVGDVSYRLIGGTVKQMVVSIPQLPQGEEATVLITFEVSRHSLLPPDETEGFVRAEFKKLPKEIRPFLGPSPLIESRHSKIKALAKQLAKEAEGKSDWEHAEMIYDWVRENVEYQTGDLKGAIRALNDKNGDCEELTSLFIALCRASDIPARTVWVPGHCYPEFYLLDDAGQGHWFPCQAAGSKAFGGIPEHRPILQKGDNFRTPEKPREPQRYVAEHLTGKGGRPKVKFVRKLLDGEPGLIPPEEGRQQGKPPGIPAETGG